VDYIDKSISPSSKSSCQGTPFCHLPCILRQNPAGGGDLRGLCLYASLFILLVASLRFFCRGLPARNFILAMAGCGRKLPIWFISERFLCQRPGSLLPPLKWPAFRDYPFWGCPFRLRPSLAKAKLPSPSPHPVCIVAFESGQLKARVSSLQIRQYDVLLTYD